MFFHPALQNLPPPRHFGFGPSSSFPQLWLQSIKLDSNKQYVSRLLRGYRRLKKLFKVRDPSPSGTSANLSRIASHPLRFLPYSLSFSFSSPDGRRSKGLGAYPTSGWNVVAKSRATVRNRRVCLLAGGRRIMCTTWPRVSENRCSEIDSREIHSRIVCHLRRGE